MTRKVFFSVLILSYLLSIPSSFLANSSGLAFSDAEHVEENNSFTQNTVVATDSYSIINHQTAISAFQSDQKEIIQAEHQMLRFSSLSNVTSFSRHVMCKGHDTNYDPVEPTTIFSPGDVKAECLTTVSINDTIGFKWYYRNDSSSGWVFCYNWTGHALSGDYDYEGHLLIGGYSPGTYFPRAYKVDVYLDGVFSFSDFFEVTNSGLNSPRMCEDTGLNGQPLNIKSRFTIGVDTKMYHSLRFNKIAYFNEERGESHNFTTVWVQPDGSTYKIHSGSFEDYKSVNASWNCWEYGYDGTDYIIVNSSIPVGNWKVETYIDSYFLNDTWKPYGPVATTPFVVGNESVADWTFMVYLDGDNSLEGASIDIFLKMANVPSSSAVNVVAQLDRIPGQDDRYDNWTDCKRFNITEGMTPTPENAVSNLSEVDMGHPDTLKDFVNWAVNNYPAKYYCLVLWDHGTGCMGVCFDITNGTDNLSLPELGQALSGLSVVMDVVLVDACSMSMVEVACQIKDYANVLVAPEGLGYAPAPYDTYLLRLSSNSSILPNAFAGKIVTDYVDWCKPIINIQNATMSATDLTKFSSLTAALCEFSVTLKEKETPYHEEISLCRNLTEVYPGPYAGQFGYYIDVYNFAQLIYQQFQDVELKDSAYQVMRALAIGNVIIIEGDKASPNSHGLAIFFPDEKVKYVPFESEYVLTLFAVSTPWDEFVKYHLSGCLLTIQTSYVDISVKVDTDIYKTDVYGRVKVFVLPAYHTVNVTASISVEMGVRGIFVRWNDSEILNPRTILVTKALSLRAEYKTQYRLIMSVNFGVTNPVVGEHWYDEHSSFQISASAPNVNSGEQYSWLGWAGFGNGSYTGSFNLVYVTMDRPVNEMGIWRHEFYLTISSVYGSPNPTSGWFEAGKPITASVVSPFAGSVGVRYVCVGWNGSGNVLVNGVNASTTFTLNEPSSVAWNWKTQFLLTVLTNPAGLSVEPVVSPSGPWYDSGVNVTCDASEVGGYVFDHWTCGGVDWGRSVDPITCAMNDPYEAVAYYARALAWWETLFSFESLQVILGLAGVVITVSLVGTAWFRSGKRRKIVKTLLGEVDDVYSKLKSDPKKCEEELYRLRNTILEGWLTDGKINEEGYSIIDKKIDKYIEELRKQKEQ